MNIDPIQNYFGDKIALFFTFNQHFCSKLQWISVLGVLVFIADMICLYKGNAEVDAGILPSRWIEWYHYLRLIFTFFVVIWTTVLLEYWKRVEKNFSIRFGQEGFKDQETDRANFHG